MFPFIEWSFQLLEFTGNGILQLYDIVTKPLQNVLNTQKRSIRVRRLPLRVGMQKIGRDVSFKQKPSKLTRLKTSKTRFLLGSNKPAPVITKSKTIGAVSRRAPPPSITDTARVTKIRRLEGELEDLRSQIQNLVSKSPLELSTPDVDDSKEKSSSSENPPILVITSPKEKSPHKVAFSFPKQNKTEEKENKNKSRDSFTIPRKLRKVPSMELSRTFGSSFASNSSYSQMKAERSSPKVEEAPKCPPQDESINEQPPTSSIPAPPPPPPTNSKGVVVFKKEMSEENKENQENMKNDAKRSVRKPLQSSQPPSISLNDIIAQGGKLRKVSKRKSPGGTPTKSPRKDDVPEESKDHQDLIANALKRKFQHIRPISPECSPCPVDSSWDD